MSPGKKHIRSHELAYRKKMQPVKCRESIFDILALDYDSWFEEEGKLVFAIEAEAFRRVLPSLPKPWLEVGVGSGRFAQALGIENGIDPSDGLLGIARSRGINVVRARGEEQIFEQAGFGTVFIIVTLCFVDSPFSVLREAHRVLYTGGKVAIGLVLSDSPWGRFYSIKKKQGHRFYKHATFYRYHEVANLLEYAGFAIERIISTLFQKPNSVAAMETPREGLFSEAGFTTIVAEKITEGDYKANKGRPIRT
jgi:ubiquinone/menaquinone biosynthesis C-methylase UbiE